MSKKTDDSIERIFRKAVTQYERTFEESDWSKMEKLLDEEASKRAAIRSKRIRGTAYTLTGLIGVIIAVYFLTFNSRPDSVSNLNSLSPKMQAAEDIGTEGNVDDETSSAGLLSNSVKKDSVTAQMPDKSSSQKTYTPDRAETKLEITDQEHQYSTAKSLSAPSDISNPPLPRRKNSRELQTILGNTDVTKDKASVLVPTPIDEKSQTVDELISDADIKSRKIVDTSGSNSRSTPTLSNSELSSGPSLGQRLSPTDDPNITNKSNSSNSGKTNELLNEPSGDFVESGIIVSDSASPQSPSETVNVQIVSKMTDDRKSLFATPMDSVTAENGIHLVDVDSLQQTPRNTASKQTINLSSRWSVGVLFTPEFSTTRLNHYSTPGMSLGLRIGYQLSNRFHINTGIIRSTKKYEDNADEYNANPNYWRNRTNGIMPEEIDGECLVLEVPFDIQFNALSTPKSRIFISTGISSYFMLSQSYKYRFEAPNPGAENGWNSSESESYWLGVGTVSAGYERNITPSFAIGIEPYLKVALTEIGWPNINLLSTGAYITLRYKFLERKN